MSACKHCKGSVIEGEKHYCPVLGHEVDADTSLLISAGIALATDSAILGGLLGGSIVGGLIGDLLDGDLGD